MRSLASMTRRWLSAPTASTGADRNAVGRSALLPVAFAVAIQLAPAPGQAASPPAPAPIDATLLQTAIDDAAGYLISQSRDDGGFVYRVNLDPAVVLAPRYNWLRHAGAVHALAQYHQLTNRAEAVPVVERAAEYMRIAAIAPVVAIPGAFAVWSGEEETGAGGPLRAKLGGAGLALAALAKLNAIKPGSVPDDELIGLARFVIAMQKPDGGYYSEFVPAEGGRRDDWDSLFYPGEAALGLIELHAIDANPDWLAAARKTLRYLAGSRHGQPDVPADHWALIATGRVWPDLDEADRAVFKRHARQVVETIMAQQIWEGEPWTQGGFSPEGRTTPTATRLEGLTAVEFLFRDEPEFHRRLQVSVSWGIRFLLNAQVKTGQYKGAIPASIQVPAGSDVAARFDLRSTEVRIDYVQHALSALIQFRAMQAADAGASPQ
jgi:hypothetical protein